MTADPFANLPPNVLAEIERFLGARDRVEATLHAIPLLEHQTAERAQFLSDLREMLAFVEVWDALWKESP